MDTSHDYGQRVNHKIQEAVLEAFGLNSDWEEIAFTPKSSLVVSFVEIGESGQHNIDRFQIILTKGNLNGKENQNLILTLYEDLRAEKQHGIYVTGGGEFWCEVVVCKNRMYTCSTPKSNLALV